MILAPRVARSLVFAAPGVAVGSACSDASEPAGECMLTFAVEPATLALVAGDSAAVRVQVVGCEPRTVRFRVDGPALAPLDTTVPPGRPVVVRAIQAGADAVRVTVTMRGLPGSAVIPATVSAPASAPRR